MTPLEVTRAVAGPTGKLGGAWMFDAAVMEAGAEHGLDLWSWYYCGRGGVLGPDPEVAVAAFGFFPPALMTKAWRKGAAVLPPAEAARLYAAACLEFSRTRFAAAPGGLADLLVRALDTAPCAGLPLFAGWRALLHSLDPASDPERLGLALQVAREHRGSNHLVAVAAAGIDPLQAVMSGRYGAGNAEFFGWPQPWPSAETARPAMLEVEQTTDRLVARAFEVLSDAERAQLAAGLRAL